MQNYLMPLQMKSKFAQYSTLYKGRPLSAFESDCIDAAHGVSPSTCPSDLDPTLIFDLNLPERINGASDERGHSRAVEDVLRSVLTPSLTHLNALGGERQKVLAVGVSRRLDHKVCTTTRACGSRPFVCILERVSELAWLGVEGEPLSQVWIDTRVGAVFLGGQESAIERRRTKFSRYNYYSHNTGLGLLAS